MHKRRKVALFLIFILVFDLLCSACSSCQRDYEHAQHLFARGEYEEAIAVFDELGNYEQAVLYSTYSRTMQLAEEGQYELAIAGFETLGGFIDSSLQAVYYAARSAEAEMRFDDAAAFYKRIPAFRDSLARLEKIPELRWQYEYDNGVASFLALDAQDLTIRTEEELSSIAAVCEQTLSFLANPLYSVANDPNLTACNALLARIQNEQDARYTAQALGLYQQAALINPETASVEELGQAQALCQEALALMEHTHKSNPTLLKQLTDHAAMLDLKARLKATHWLHLNYEAETASWVGADGTVQHISDEKLFSLTEDAALYHTEDGMRFVTADGQATDFIGYTLHFSYRIPADLICVGTTAGVGLLRKDGSLVISPAYDEIDYCGQYEGHHYFSVKSNGCWALADDTGSILTEAVWDSIGSISEGLICVKLGSNYGFINCQGEEVVPCVWTKVNNFHDGRALVEEGDYAGYIDQTGELVIPIIWSIPSDFSEGLASVYGYKNDLTFGFQYINQDGDVVIRHSNKLQSGGDFFDGVAVVSDYDAEKETLINARGAVIHSTATKIANWYLDGYVRIMVNDKWGMIDRNGHTVISPEMEAIDVYPYASTRSEDEQYLVIVTKNGQKGIFDQVSKTISYFEGELYRIHDRIYYTSKDAIFPEDGLIGIVKDGAYGCINFKGQVVIPLQYDDALDFHAGYSVAARNGRYGYVDAAGNAVIPCEWDGAEPVKNGFALVKKDGAFHVLNVEGQLIW